MNILHCAIFECSLCVTKLKFLNAYTALCGFLLPPIRYHAEISNFFHNRDIVLFMRYHAEKRRRSCVNMRFSIIRCAVLYHC